MKAKNLMNPIRTYNKIAALLSEIKNSIAFYPGIITLSFAVLALVLISVENQSITKFIFEQFPSLFISDADTARGVLNTLTGGIISLTVFSFSMVMILLNQASSNYSPRLLPGLITDKRHQFVLGFYLGTVVYLIICSISIIPGEGPYEIPGLSILVAILFGISCLGLFVYFIHNISQSIQITNILYQLFSQIKSTYQDYPQEKALESVQTTDDQYKWFDRSTAESGFLTQIARKGLKTYALDNQLMIRCRAYEGVFLLPGERLYQVDQDISEKTHQEIVSYFKFSEKNQSLNVPFVALKHITEVALKAMSPGINDPGTAQLAIYYIIQLFAIRIKTPERQFYRSDAGRPLLIIEEYPFDKLLHQTMASLRNYVAHDTLIVKQLLKGIQYLNEQTAMDAVHYKSLKKQEEILLLHAEQSIQLELDFKTLKN